MLLYMDTAARHCDVMHFLCLSAFNLLPTVSHFSGFCKQVYLATARGKISHSQNLSTQNLYGSKGLFECNARVNFYGYTLQYEPNKRP